MALTVELTVGPTVRVNNATPYAESDGVCVWGGGVEEGHRL